MTVNHSSFSTIIVVSLAVWSIGFTKAHAQKTYDSILNSANAIIYENPNKAIQMGMEVYHAQNSNLEEKADAMILISTGYSSKRDYEMSLEYANRALALLPQIKSKGFKIKILNKLGAQYQQLKVYDKALSYLDSALEIANTIKNKDSISKLLGYNYGARGFIYREQMSCDIALSYFNKSLFYFHKSLKMDPLMNANISIIQYNKGNCFMQSSQVDSAKISFDHAINFAQTNRATSLEAFAKKGLAEVFTSQGKYADALSTLKEALSASSNVGDLVLNQSIYNGLANNYLATGDKESFEFYRKKYDETILDIKTIEVTTINNSLKQLFEENDKELAQMKSKIILYKLAVAFMFFAFLIIIACTLFSHKKKSKSLKNEAKLLQ